MIPFGKAARVREGKDVTIVTFGARVERALAPVRRIGALDTFVGYNPVLEDAILPQVSTIAAAVRELVRY